MRKFSSSMILAAAILSLSALSAAAAGRQVERGKYLVNLGQADSTSENAEERGGRGPTRGARRSLSASLSGLCDESFGQSAGVLA